MVLLVETPLPEYIYRVYTIQLKLTFRKYPAIHTNYIITHCTTL